MIVCLVDAFIKAEGGAENARKLSAFYVVNE